MKWSRTLQLVDLHCEGEIGRVVTDGLPVIPGQTIAEKYRELSQRLDPFLRSLVMEPRGAAAGSVNLLFPPHDPANHAGFIVLQPDQPHAMSGSNAICVTTCLVETGMVPSKDGMCDIRLETAAGLVVAKAHCADGSCKSVTLEMPVSYVVELDRNIDCEATGSVKADICFGGVFYAIVDASQLGLKIRPENARALADAGMALKAAANAQFEVRHAENPDIAGIAYVMFRELGEDGSVRTATTMWPGRLDRSPCGTGNSANLAAMAARGQVEPGDRFISYSTVGSEFQVHHAGEAEVAGQTGVRPEITGRAWTYGMHQIGIHPDDPFSAGFALTDTWGPEAGKL